MPRSECNRYAVSPTFPLGCSNRTWKQIQIPFRRSSDRFHRTGWMVTNEIIMEIAKKQNRFGEEFLDRPDIIPILQEMGRERMPEGMAGDGLLDTGPLARLLDGTLYDGFVEVMPEEAAGGRLRKLPVCGKYPLPPPLVVSGLVLPLERFRKCNVAAPLFQIPFVPTSHRLEVMMQAGFRCLGKDGDAVPVSLSFQDEDLPVPEVDILYAETEAFEQPQTDAVHEHRRKPFHAVQVPQYRLHLPPGQHHGEAFRSLRSDDSHREYPQEISIAISLRLLLGRGLFPVREEQRPCLPGGGHFRREVVSCRGHGKAGGLRRRA